MHNTCHAHVRETNYTQTEKILKRQNFTWIGSQRYSEFIHD